MQIVSSFEAVAKGALSAKLVAIRKVMRKQMVSVKKSVFLKGGEL